MEVDMSLIAAPVRFTHDENAAHVRGGTGRRGSGVRVVTPLNGARPRVFIEGPDACAAGRREDSAKFVELLRAAGEMWKLVT
jgi:hypothetical protein